MFTARTRLVCLLPVCLAPICLLPVFLLLVMPQGAARADGAALPPTARQAKGVKRTTVDVKDIERRITRPEAPAPAAAKERQPGVGLDDFMKTKNKVITQITKHQIAKMRALIAATPEDDAQKPDFFFRAGELYVEMKRFFFSRARALDQPIFELPAERRGPLQAEQRSYEH